MSNNQPTTPIEKAQLHPRNPHQGRYDLQQLALTTPELKPFISINKFNIESVNFADPEAVKMLNRALLRHYYAMEYWDIPSGYLCPPIPGRADYIHHIAEFLGGENRNIIPQGKTVKVLDIGVGANAVYPIIGNKEYGWTFVGTDTDKTALLSAKTIVEKNQHLSEALICRHQKDANMIFNGIFQPEDEFDLVICNPPFHATDEEVLNATHRKWKNLGKKKADQGVRNFGGQNAELFYPGGEEAFVSKMIAESADYAQRCYAFSSLIARGEHMHAIHRILKKNNAVFVRIIPMSQGQKNSRIIIWSFLDENKRKEWRERKFWG